jgi:alpha-beta hydrolase superfamily lysophospholipase
MIGFDLRGHGRTGGTRGHFPSLEAVLQDIRRLFQTISEKYPGLPQFIYGHSLGGLLSLTYAIQYGSELGGAVITGAGLRSPLAEQKGKVAMAKILGSALPAMTIPSGLEVAGISRDPDVVQKYINDPLVHDKASMGLGKAGLTAVDMCFARAREFAPPLLIMHGKADRITYSNGSEDFAKLVSEKNNDVTLKLWDGLYHEIHNEPEKAEVFKFMVEWLGKHLK